MALNLNIPSLEENPIIIAETRPQKISLSLTSLRTQNPLDIASYLHTELEILNRQKVSPGHRIQALDTYRPILISTARTLAEDYSDTTLPLQNKAKLAAAAAESLWLELGYGYKLALVDLQNQLIKIGNNSACSIQRAMHAVAEHALVYYQTYVSPPSHIWSDLHQLYFCAVQLGIHNIEINNTNTTSERTSSSSPSILENTIENTYKHALLMSLADTQHLSQKNIRLTAEFLANHVKDAQITAAIPLESSSAAFIISLKSNNPPTPYSKQKIAPDPNSDILLQTIDLVRTIHQHLSNLQNNQLVNASRDNYIDLLSYLIKHWGITPKRVFSRLLKNGELELVTGISAIHHFSGNDPSAINITNEHTNAWLSSENAQHIKPSRWQILNISPTGISIRRHPTAEKNIKIGTLLGMKAKDEHHWSIGVVRWANCGSRDRLDIGVQLIAPHIQSAIARIDKREHDEKVLLLPQITAVKQVATIIAPRGTFEPARQLTLKYNNETKLVMLTKIVERFQYFERMQYSIIS